VNREYSEQVSLSVLRTNPAVRLYRSAGFQMVDDSGQHSDTMALDVA
jgi:ribosomal protein S18 acetylase RimI-like enzyme